MPLLFSFLAVEPQGPGSARHLRSFQDKPVHGDYIEGRSKSFMHVSLCDISMLNNSQRHPKISVECRVTHTFQGLACVRAIRQKRGTFTGTWP